jgi:hypothetical protein
MKVKDAALGKTQKKSDNQKQKQGNDENTHKGMETDPSKSLKRPQPQPRCILRPVLGPADDPTGISALGQTNESEPEGGRLPLGNLAVGDMNM